MAARLWFMERMTELGLNTKIDGIGNVICRSVGSGPRLLIGSHLETQPYAGWLDGALGMIYGLEVVRTFAETPSCSRFAIDVGAWADEEGYYGAFLGSRSFCDEITDEELEISKNRYDGKPLKDSLIEVGLADCRREKIIPGEYAGYLEAHIEQGDYLESSGLRLGIVTGIVGIRLYKIKFLGVQNHAGTTRMIRRKDAGVALMRLWHSIDQKFSSVAGPRSVWTVGSVALEPGSISVIPGKAEMVLQVRDVEVERLDLLERTLTGLIAEANNGGPCKIELEIVASISPVAMDPLFQDALERAADCEAIRHHTRMPSAAGHDAQVFARHLPAGMLFVPSIGGISHHYTEDTKEEDIILGCQVFANAAEHILSGAA
jgi:N-carbamoyl-L-amino-acid hydrolase